MYALKARALCGKGRGKLGNPGLQQKRYVILAALATNDLTPFTKLPCVAMGLGGRAVRQLKSLKCGHVDTVTVSRFVDESN